MSTSGTAWSRSTGSGSSRKSGFVTPSSCHAPGQQGVRSEGAEDPVALLLVLLDGDLVEPAQLVELGQARGHVAGAGRGAAAPCAGHRGVPVDLHRRRVVGAGDQRTEAVTDPQR